MKVRQTFIGGSRKMIVYDDVQATEKVKVYDKGITINGTPEKAHELRIGYRAGDMWAPHLSAKEALQTEADHFIACVCSGASPISNGIMGLRVIEILEAASRSIAEKGNPVRIEQRKSVCIKGKDRVIEEVVLSQMGDSTHCSSSYPPRWDACPDFAGGNVVSTTAPIPTTAPAPIESISLTEEPCPKYAHSSTVTLPPSKARPAKVTPSAISSSCVINTCGIATTCAPILKGVVMTTPANSNVPGPRMLP